MNLNPAAVLNPVFNFLDALIQNYGVYLFHVFVCLALVVIAWVLCGGLRSNRPRGNPGAVVHGIIFTMQPPIQPPPSIIIADFDPAQNGDDESLNEP